MNKTKQAVKERLNLQLKTIDGDEVLYGKINDCWDVEIMANWNKKDKDFTMVVWNISDGTGYGAKRTHSFQRIPSIEALDSCYKNMVSQLKDDHTDITKLTNDELAKLIKPSVLYGSQD